MADHMTYEQAMKRIEDIVRELEQTEALSVTVYKQKAKEANDLLAFCESQLLEMEKSLSEKSE